MENVPVATAATSVSTAEAASMPQPPHQRMTQLERQSATQPAPQLAPNVPARRRLSDTRTAITHKFDIVGHVGYLTVGLFEDGQPGELYVTMNGENETTCGLLDSMATLTSIALQFGVPVEYLVKKMRRFHYGPNGLTKNPEIQTTASITDYIFRWLGNQFVPGFKDVSSNQTGPVVMAPPASTAIEGDSPKANPFVEQTGKWDRETMTCPKCGHDTVVEAGLKCLNCGAKY